MSLSDDERILLTALATAGKPIDLHELMQRVMPPRPDGPEWYGQQWWGRQWGATAKNFIDLRAAGMFKPAAWTIGDVRVSGYVLTNAGREALAGAKEQA